MEMKLSLAAIALAAMSVSMPSHAETYSEVYNGATCIPYPPFDTDVAVPYSSWLYNFGGGAYCHFTIPNGWSAKSISYVLFEGSSPGSSDLIRVRLCVYSRLTQTCGAEKTMSGYSGINWVDLPAPLPTYVTGAYLSVAFPADKVSTLMNYIPVFQRWPTISTVLLDSALSSVAQLDSEAAAVTRWRETLRADFEMQPQSKGWAMAKESELRQAATRTTDLPADLLQSLECRTDQCRARAVLSPANGKALQEQLANITQWVESSPECQYTLLHDQASEKGMVLEVITSCGTRK